MASVAYGTSVINFISMSTHVYILHFNLSIKGTQSNLSQVSIECIGKVIQNALIFNAR